MTWRASLTALVESLRKHPRVELRVFHLFPPASDVSGVPAGLVDLYRETDGVQLAWVDRTDPTYDPAEPRWEDSAAPWDLPGSAGAARWSGAIWLLPAAMLGQGHLDTWGAGILLDGGVARLPDGTVGPAEDVVRHLVRWWGSVLHRAGPVASDQAHVPIERILAELPETPADVSLVVHVAEVRRMATDDATWAWVDRGLEPDAIGAVWADAGGFPPAEIVELELEIDALPPSLFPGAGAPDLVAQLLGPWGYPDRFVVSVDLTERPRWVVAFAAAPLASFEDSTAEATDDTEINLLPIPLVAPTVPMRGEPIEDAEPDRPGFQFAVAVRHPGVDSRPRVHPAPIAIGSRRSWRPYPDGVLHELAASPDGQHLAALAESGELRLWALSDGAEVPLEPQREPESFSEIGFGRDGLLAVWDGSLVTRWETDGSAAGFIHHSMSGLSRFEASDRQFALWTDRPVLLDIRGDHHGTIDAIDEDPVSHSGLSPDGGTLAVGTEGGRICAFRLEDFRRIWCVATDLGEIHAVAAAPLGRAIAAGGREAVVILDAEGHELRRLPAHEGSVSGLVWLQGTRFLASAGDDRILRIWCGRSGSLLIEEVFPAPIRKMVGAAGWLAVATADRITLLTLDGLDGVFTRAPPAWSR